MKATVQDAHKGSQEVIVLPFARRREFERFVDEAGRAITQTAFFICRDRDRAEDLVAEALARVWPRWRDGQIEELGPYVRKTVTNLAYKQQRRHLVSAKYEAQFETMMSSPPSEDSAARIDLIEELLRLPLAQRAVLVLRFFDDMSEAEVADALGISTGTVKSRTARGLEALRSNQARLSDV